MLPSDVPAAVLIQMADGAPTSPTLPLPGPLRAPRGRMIELPSNGIPSLSLAAQPAFDNTPSKQLLH